MITIHTITETLAKHLVAKHEFHDFMLALGVDVVDWPDSKAKRIAETYIALREKENHEYAVHILAGDAKNLKIDYDVPMEPGALKVLYRDHLKVYRTKRLADQLAVSEPSEYDRLVDEYLSAQTKGIKLHNFADEMVSLIKANEEARGRGEAIVAIPHWERLSEAIGGFNQGRVSMLVAETGFGKTNLALSFARCAAEVGPVLFVNMEMMSQDLGDRLLLSAANMRFRDYKAGQYNHKGIQDAADSMRGKRLLYTDGKSLSMQEIFALARREKSGHGLFMLFVDYDQKIKVNVTRETPEWKALQLAVEQLEELAKQLSINVCLMAQSNEDGDPSGSKRSKYAASTVLRFYKHEGKAVIQAIKNRFGEKDIAIEVDYQPDRSLACEVGWADVKAMAPARKRLPI